MTNCNNVRNDVRRAMTQKGYMARRRCVLRRLAERDLHARILVLDTTFVEEFGQRL